MKEKGNKLRNEGDFLMLRMIFNMELVSLVYNNGMLLNVVYNLDE